MTTLMRIAREYWRLAGPALTAGVWGSALGSMIYLLYPLFDLNHAQMPAIGEVSGLAATLPLVFLISLAVTLPAALVIGLPVLMPLLPLIAKRLAFWVAPVVLLS